MERPYDIILKKLLRGKGLRSDRDLLENSMAFDLGLEKSSPKSAVEALIAKLEHWFVMITEYMDHSLVLLRRRMCWDLDDVVYYGIKVVLKSFIFS